MKLFTLLLLSGFGLLLTGSAVATDINGAGSSAAQPLYDSWAKAYKAVSQDNVYYDPSGSTAGITKARDRSADFGATDIAIASSDANNASLFCVPTAISGIVPFVNLPGIRAGQLVLSGPVLADIYQRKIKNWNDAAIAALNPGKSLPNLPISPVARLDGSGTTFIFTDFLSKTSPEWHDNFGANMIIRWPEGVGMVKGSAGVINEVTKTVGAIGFVDYGYILEHHLTYVSLQNREKRAVEPTFGAFNSALTNSDWKTQATFEEMLTDRPGADTWPITTATFILIPKVTTNPAKTTVALKFLTWAFLHGDDIARKVGYVRLSDPLQAKVFRVLMQVKDNTGKGLNWTPF